MNCFNSCENCPVFEKSLFKDFDTDLINWLKEKKQNKEFNKGDILFAQGEAVEGLYCHGAGLSKVIQTDKEGKIRFTRLVFEGDTSGHRSLFIKNNYQGMAVAISEKVNACFISINDISFLLTKNLSFAKNLIIKISEELNRSENEQMATKEKTVRSRLALLLYQIGLQHSIKTPDGEYMIKTEVTKRELAKLLLVADETVIRLMSEMNKDGLITYEGKKLIIKDLQKILEQTIY